MPATLLLIEDDPQYLYSIKSRIAEAFPEHDIEVVGVEHALDKAMPGVYRAAIFDLHHLDATGVMDLANKITQHTPVLIWSSTVTPEMPASNPKLWTLPRNQAEHLPSVLRDMLAPSTSIARELAELRSILAGIIPILERTEQQHEIINRYLFLGNGSPSIVRQLEAVAVKAEAIDERLEKVEEDYSRLRSLIWKGLAAIGTIVTVAASIVTWITERVFK